MANISQALYRDLQDARRAKANDQKRYELVRMTKKGEPSKMADDTTLYNSMDAVSEYVERVAKLNPQMTFVYQLRDRVTGEVSEIRPTTTTQGG